MLSKIHWCSVRAAARGHEWEEENKTLTFVETFLKAALRFCGVLRRCVERVKEGWHEGE